MDRLDSGGRFIGLRSSNAGANRADLWLFISLRRCVGQVRRRETLIESVRENGRESVREEVASRQWIWMPMQLKRRAHESRRRGENQLEPHREAGVL